MGASVYVLHIRSFFLSQLQSLAKTLVNLIYQINERRDKHMKNRRWNGSE